MDKEIVSNIEQDSALLYIVLPDERENNAQCPLYVGYDHNKATDARIRYLRRHEVGEHGVFNTRKDFDAEVAKMGKARFVKFYYCLNNTCANLIRKRVAQNKQTEP